MAGIRIPSITKIHKVKTAKPARSPWQATIGIENRRLTGDTRAKLKGYQASPARFLPSTLQALAGATKVRG